MEEGTWYDYVKNADVAIVSPLSTIVGECLLCGVPTITARIEPSIYDLSCADIVQIDDWSVNNICRAIMYSIGRTPDNEEFVNYHFSHNLDGKSIERVVDATKEIINDK